MKRNIFLNFIAFGLSSAFLFAGCDFLDLFNSDNSLNVYSIDVTEAGTYEIPSYYQNEQAILVAYNDTNQNMSAQVVNWDYENINTVSESRSIGNTSSENSVTEETGFKNKPVKIEYDQFFVEPDSSCSDDSRAISFDSAYGNYDVGDSKSFYACVNNGNSWKQKSAVKKINGKYCDIWYIEKDGIIDGAETYIEENEGKSVTIDMDSQLQTLADKFDLIYPVETSLLCSSKSDNLSSSVYQDKIQILVYDVKDDYSEGQDRGTYGFFNNKDLIQYPSSNYCEMFYIDSYFLCIDFDDQISTLAHEFQHMLGYIEKVVNYKQSSYGETWYTEMLSMMTEEVLGDVIGVTERTSVRHSRLNYYFLGNSEKGFMTWADDFDTQLANYGNAYAFGAYLMRNYGGIKVLQEIFRNQYLNKTSITEALGTLDYDIDFNEALRLFPLVTIYQTNTDDYPTLYKSSSMTIGDTKVSIPDIYIQNYYSYYWQKSSGEDYWDDSIMIEGKNGISNPINSLATGTSGSTEYYLLKGPVLWLDSSSMEDSTVRPGGFALYYLGNIESFEMNSNYSNLKYYIVFQD